MKRVKWEPWIDPLDSDDTENEIEEEKYNDGYDSNNIPQITQQKVLQTPFGIFPVNILPLGSESFDFWILQTNFEITLEIVRQIESVPGVESLDIFTRYRARVGFPRSGLFDAVKVRAEIAKVITKNLYIPNPIISNVLKLKFSDDFANRINSIIEDVAVKYDFWTIYILPNGHYDICTGNSDKELTDHLQTCTQLQEDVGGYLITYKDFLQHE